MTSVVEPDQMVYVKEHEKWTVHRWKHGQTDDGQKTSSDKEKSHFSF